MSEGEVDIRPEQVVAPEREQWAPYERVAEMFKVSKHRLRRLLNTGVIEGEKKPVETSKGVRDKWFSTFEKVAVYFQQTKPTPSEAGRRPPRKGMRERGRPKLRFPQQGVVFQA